MEPLYCHGRRYSERRSKSIGGSLQDIYCTYRPRSEEDNLLICLQTEQDFAAIAGAGLNWIRLPIPFWAVEKWDGEPFLEKVAWKWVYRYYP